MDGVGKSIVGVQIFDTQPAIEHVSVSLYIQRFERPVQMDVAKTAPLHVLRYVFDERPEEGDVQIVGSEEERQPGVFADGIYVAADIRPSRIVLVDTA